MEKAASEIERKLKILTYRGECGASVEGETNIERERERERPTDQTKKNWRVLDRMSFSASVSPVVVKGRTSLGEINGKDSLDGE